MTDQLIELSFGPVQGFIAAARRSRDLWAGSFILSEIARAAGRALLDAGATLIYPAEGRVRGDNPEEASNLSNVLLARLPTATAEQARAVAQRAIDAGRARLAEFAHDARQEWERAGVQIRADLWARQVDDAIEAYAAWAALEGDYRAAYTGLKAAFAARKNTRDFAPMSPPDAPWAEAPKNSLDGLRESVLPDGRDFPRRFGLSPGEQLDALGCIKRVVGRRERFTALTRLAAHDWLGTLPGPTRSALAAAYEPLVRHDLASRASSRAYADFPYDAALLYPERLEIARREAADDAAARAALDRLQALLKPVWRAHGRPCPYAVLVVADGDRMGKFVDAAGCADDHRSITQAVARFADQVPALAQAHGGQCVFNGGEDLTVLYPLSGVVEGARALASAFDASLREVAQRLLGSRYAQERPTLRVGAAICHVLEPLGVIRQWAGEAEKFAKGEAGTSAQGNALGLVLHLRAGHEVALRIGFEDAAAFAALDAWVNAYRQGAFPGRLAYDCRAIALACEARGMASVAAAEFARLLDRARESGGGQSLSEAHRQALQARRGVLCDGAGDPTGLKRLANELLIARWLSARRAGDITSLEGSGR